MHNDTQSIAQEMLHFVVYHLFLMSLFCLTKPLGALADMLSKEDDIKFLPEK